MLSGTVLPGTTGSIAGPAMSSVPRIAAPEYPVSRTSGAGTFDCDDTTKARTQVSLPGTRRSRLSDGPCDSTCANSIPATVATQPPPTTTLPPATDGCEAESSMMAAHARPAGMVNTSCVADFEVIVAATLATRTPDTSMSPVPVIVTLLPAAATRYTAAASTRMAGTTCSADAAWLSSPALARTRNTPLAAASGTTAVTRVVPVRVAMLAVAPLAKTMAVARSRLVPTTVSVCPVTTVAGVNDVTANGPTTVIGCGSARAAPAVSTSVREPEAAVPGTSSTSDAALRVAMFRARLARRASRTRSRLEPVSVSCPGATTVAGDTLATVGTSSTVRSAADSTTRPAALSSTRLVFAAAGTVSSSEVSDSTRNVASTPFNLTEVTALSNVPETLTTLPGTAEVGAKPEIVNGGVLGAGALLACAAEVGAALSPPPQAPTSALAQRTA